jgi:mannosyl-3-phosphoglycerate phosphatase
VFQEKKENQIFLQAAEARGLHWTRGRLYCLMGEHDKGKAVRLLKKAYETEHGKIISIGLGDALNDLPLLGEVDVPVLVQNQNRTHDQNIRVPGLVRAQGVGPEGWNIALLDLLRNKEQVRRKN